MNKKTQLDRGKNMRILSSINTKLEVIQKKVSVFLVHTKNGGSSMMAHSHDRKSKKKKIKGT